MLIERFIKKRKEAGLTVQDAAESVGISRSTLYRYENGELQNMPSKTLQALARLYQTTPSYLLGWEEKEDFSYVETFKVSRPLTSDERKKVESFIKVLTE